MRSAIMSAALIILLSGLPLSAKVLSFDPFALHINRLAPESPLLNFPRPEPVVSQDGFIFVDIALLFSRWTSFPEAEEKPVLVFNLNRQADWRVAFLFASESEEDGNRTDTAPDIPSIPAENISPVPIAASGLLMLPLLLLWSWRIMRRCNWLSGPGAMNKTQ